MALPVVIAHTGQRLEADSGSFASIDTFRAWAAKTAGLNSQEIIIITGQGKAVKLQHLREKETIFVYDGQVMKASAKPAGSLVTNLPLPPKYQVESPPDTITDQNDLQAWKDLFMARRTWALKVVEDSGKMSDIAQQRYTEIDMIRRALFAAIDNLHIHIEPLDHQLAGAQNWSSEMQRDHKHVVTDADDIIKRLRASSVDASIVKFIRQDAGNGRQQASLADLLDNGALQDAVRVGGKAMNTIARVVTDLGQMMDRLVEGADNITDQADKSSTKSALQRSSESINLLQDIEVTARKVNSDYETVLGYEHSPKNISQASRTALLHTKTILPILSKRSQEMHGLLEIATDMRNTASIECVELMQAITGLNTMCAEFSVKLNNISISEDEHQALEVLAFTDKLPVTYASFVAEAIKRREWSEKVKSDSSTLANEMATFQEEEERRRKKWQKANGMQFGPVTSDYKVLGVEVNVQGEEVQWPQAHKTELQNYLQTLKSGGYQQDMIRQVTQIIADLNTPTKQQNKRANAFKNGSFHEAAIGRSTLLVRGDDDLLRSLQEDKTRLENRNKSAESRIRRLEDLLHRQVAKAPTADSFQPMGISPDTHYSLNAMQSPRLNGDLSRRSSVSSRRFSSNLGPEEKANTQRLISLEAELIAEREKASGLERELAARASSTTAIEDRMEEANSTKQDLLQNLEAQQNEFGIERKSLEADIRDLKAKIESYEDEMDRILGSRENEKANIDEQVRSLRQELERQRTESAAEAQKAQGQVDYLRNDAKLQRESNESLSKQLSKLEDNAQVLKTQVTRSEDLAAGHVRAMHTLYSLLRPKDCIPAEPEALTNELVNTARDVVSQLSLHKNEINLIKNDHGTTQILLAEAKQELVSLEEKLKVEDTQSGQLREDLASQQAKFRSLESELADERQQLSQLRAKFAAGETGSESLRSRVEEEERKVTALSEELAGRRSRVGSLEEELLSVQDRLQTSQAKLDSLNTRFDARTGRTKDLTQRLYVQNDRLRRLLERMSYSITREGDSMIIQRIPKTERANANDSSDPGTSGRRSVAGLAPQGLAESADLDLLYWMHNSDVAVEQEKFEAYLAAMGNFDVEAFCETMLKRVKDVEHTARKYTRDARAYREKYQRVQKEAHEKIAYKNFKDGDLALFLPTRNQTTGAWAAFNVGAPHYFLHEHDSHKLRSRDWLLARIQKIEERVVDLAKSMTANAGDGRSIGEASNGGDSYEDDNPFDLSDGLRWYLIDAAEEKPGAPSTPGLGKSTVAATSVDATGTIRRTKKGSIGGVEGVSKTLTRSLDSRRSSSNSKKAITLLGTSSKAPASLSDASGIAKALPTSLETGESSVAAADGALGTDRLEVPTDGKSPPKMPEGSSNEGATSTSPSKRSMIWDSLWSLDVSMETGGKGGKK